ITGPSLLVQFPGAFLCINAVADAWNDANRLDELQRRKRGGEIPIVLSDSTVTAKPISDESEYFHAGSAEKRLPTTCDQRRAHGQAALRSCGTRRHRSRSRCSCSHCGIGVVNPVFARRVTACGRG